MNGKDTVIQDNHSSKKSIPNVYEQQAATVEKSFDPEDLIEYEKNHDPDDVDDWVKEIKSKKKKKNSKIPPGLKLFGIAAASAAIIGVTLGFIMLRMFVGIDNDGQGSRAITSIATENTSTEGSSGVETTSLTIDALQAVVIQGAVLSSQSKAEEVQQQFSQAGIESMIWESNGQYHLFAGVSNTEQGLTEPAQAMTDSGLEIWAGKPWNTETVDVNVSESSGKWLQIFPELWRGTISSSDIASESSKWEEWLTGYPDDASDQVALVKAEGDALIKSMDENKSTNALQVHLLKMWKLYQDLGKE